jgi:quercetin dioxygenase-like cupin family protein
MPYIDFNTRNKTNVLPGFTGSMAHSKQLSFGQFTIDKDSILSEHNHPHEQWTYLIQGELEFDIDGEKQLLTSGKTAFIPSGLPHSAKAITECKVIYCFSPVREDLINLEKEQIIKK